MNNNSLPSHCRIHSSKEVLTKLKIVLGVKSAKELATIFQVKPNTISSWKKRDSLCYIKLIQVCNQYKIDLNELFLADYPYQTIEKSHHSIPIIYIEDYLEYYLSIEGKPQKLKHIYYPKPVCFEIVIQLYAVLAAYQEPRLIYACCKKVDFAAVEVGYHYAFLLVQKGFQSYTIVEVDQNKKVVYVQKETTEIKELKADDILEIFQCMTYLPC